MTSFSKIERVAILAGFVALALWYASFHRVPGVDHDVFHIMSLARETLALGHVPHQDLHSYAETRHPVVQHEWLAGMIALGAYRAAGVYGFGLLWWGISLGCAALCARALARLRPAMALAAGFAAVPLVTYSLYQPSVPQAYSVLMCGLFLVLLERETAGKRGALLTSVLLFVLWTNLHGGVVVGFGALGAYTLEQRLRGERYGRLAALFAVLLLAVVVNPYTWHYYPYLARALTMPRPHIGQWQPDWIFRAEPPYYQIPLVLMLAAYLYAVAAAGWRFRGALITALLAAASLRAHKMLPFFGIAWLFYVPAVLSATRLGEAAERLGRRSLPFAGPAFAVLAALFSVTVHASRPWAVCIPERRQDGLPLPVRAADYLERTGFRGNVMTYFSHGGYFSWRLYPHVKVSCDSRYEVAYPDGHVERNLDAYLEKPHTLAEELRRLPQTDLILTHRGFAAAPEIARLPGWTLAYSDAAFALYSRAASEPERISQSAPPPPGSKLPGS